MPRVSKKLERSHCHGLEQSSKSGIGAVIRPWSVVVLEMTLLELDEQEQKDRKEQVLTDLLVTEKAGNRAKTSNLLPPLPPKIGRVEKSKVLERAAAFLPQLATANQKLSSLPADAVNIETLTGNEQRVIEMKLGLGVFEEKASAAEEASKAAKVSLSTSSATKTSDSDRFDAFVQQLLTFNGSEDDEPVELFCPSTDDAEDDELLDFE